MSKITDGLNPQQLEAVLTIDGPVLVLAGAGTGKTKVITTRIAHMIASGIDPASILGVTFTNKAAKEMRERLAKIVPPKAAEKVTLGTFHSFCGKILRRDIRYAGNYDSRFTIADATDQHGLIRQAAAELGISKDEVPTDEAAAYISRCKNQCKWPDEALQETEDNPAETVLAEIYERYQQILELQNTVDFDDMLMLTIKIFKERPEILKRYRETYRYLLVDEYQDTNDTQFTLLSLLAGDHPNLCVVGDDDQSIYAWRGADIRNILDFPSRFPGTKKIKLEQNYRSTNKILKAANAVISRNSGRYDKNLWSAKGDGEDLQIIQLQEGTDEATFVADAINDLIDRNPDLCYSDCAILYRSNHLSRVFEQEFRRRGIRPKIIGGQEFFQRKEVKDAVAYLKLLDNERDDQSLLRVISLPPRGIGAKAIENLRQMQANQEKGSKKPLTRLLTDTAYQASLSTSGAKTAAMKLGTDISQFRESFKEPGSLSRKVFQYLDEVGYLNGLQRIYKDIKEADSRRENVMEFINYIGQYEQSHGGEVSLTDFMESYSLMDENDRTDDDEDRDAPIMSTVHASKGLEFPVVFLIGMEQGIFPHERALIESNGEEEERRLFYVAITRAKEYLFMSYANLRRKFNENEPKSPSRFLRDIPKDITNMQDAESYFPEADENDQYNAFAAVLRSLDQ